MLELWPSAQQALQQAKTTAYACMPADRALATSITLAIHAHLCHQAPARVRSSRDVLCQRRPPRARQRLEDAKLEELPARVCDEHLHLRRQRSKRFGVEQQVVDDGQPGREDCRRIAGGLQADAQVGGRAGFEGLCQNTIHAHWPGTKALSHGHVLSHACAKLPGRANSLQAFAPAAATSERSRPASVKWYSPSCGSPILPRPLGLGPSPGAAA